MLEALVYTQDRAVEIRCTQAFAELPLDWTMLRDSGEVSSFLNGSSVGFVVFDVDAPGGSSLLAELLATNSELRTVILAVSSAPVNAELLQMSYRSQVYYPVRPRDLEDSIAHALPFAVSLYEDTARKAQQPANRPEYCAADHAIFKDGAIHVGPLVSKTAQLASGMASWVKGMLQMKHSLSIMAQERAASILSSVGVMWYVQEITSDFRGLQFINPPSPGPTYLIALSLLLWLCAKSRRATSSVSSELALS